MGLSILSIVYIFNSEIIDFDLHRMYVLRVLVCFVLIGSLTSVDGAECGFNAHEQCPIGCDEYVKDDNDCDTCECSNEIENGNIMIMGHGQFKISCDSFFRYIWIRHEINPRNIKDVGG